jgi:3-phenylpropionate/trans-cinnamate dioxygenase ferredoxin subunit
MVFTKAGQADKVAEGAMIGVELGGKKMVISNLNGTFYAIGSKCTHRGCNLSRGKIEGERVICPCHGSAFNLKTGEVVRGPAGTSEPSFSVKVENGELMVDL